MDLVTTVERLLPTSTRVQGRNQTANRHNPNSQHHDGITLEDVRYSDRFGDYAEAIHQHAHMVGRPAPEPAIDRRLNPQFVEWMMGLPEGWVTDPTLDLSRTVQLRILGNGVVPQQAVAAFRSLM